MSIVVSEVVVDFDYLVANGKYIIDLITLIFFLNLNKIPSILTLLIAF